MEGRSFAAHDSRQMRYRFPFGAVTEGERITLNIDCGADVRNAKLRIWTEGRERIEHGVRTDAGFGFTFYAGTSGLEWYYFLLDTDEGGYILGSDSPLGCGGSRIFTHDPNSWQITVYEREFETPKAAEGATAYQIFPDRFNRIGRGGLARTGRREELGWTTVKHEDWNEEVLWTPLPGQNDYDPCDFYGGDFEGIEARLDYLQSIGVTLIYMNPVFEAQSNHRYNTGDYHRTDDMLGGEEGLKKLIRAAKARGISIMLDGVFSHTGDESVYFNRKGNYPGLGAYQGEGSAYYDWYEFSRFPDKYGCWWGFKSLPEVKETNRGYMAFVAGVIDHYAKLGIESWRLDVADELPDEFIAFLRRELKARAKDGILIGEVWEDASTKQGGCGRRKYTDGRELDGVMNYVFADAVISFLTGKQDAEALCLALTALRQNYPKAFYDSCLTMLSSHDTVRLLTVLAGAPDRRSVSREVQAHFVPEESRLNTAKKLMTLAQLIQLTHPGIPCIYYGDEAGMQGLCDPFNRAPLQMCDTQMLQWYAQLTTLRHAHPALTRGEVAVFAPAGDVLCILRVIADGRDAFGEEAENEALLLIVNRAAHPVRCHAELTCPGAGLCEETRLAFVRSEYDCAAGCFDDTHIVLHDGVGAFDLPPHAAKIYRLENRHGTETGS